MKEKYKAKILSLVPHDFRVLEKTEIVEPSDLAWKREGTNFWGNACPEGWLAVGETKDAEAGMFICVIRKIEN